MNVQTSSILPVEQPLVLGKIGAAYGIRGWLKLFSFTEKKEAIFDYQPWAVQHAGQWCHLPLEEWKYHGQNFIIKIKNIDDRNRASTLTNNEIVIDAGRLPSLEAGNYYWSDLINCRVVTISGYELGKVTAMLETGANDVMVVKAVLKDAFGVTERLIPFLDEQVIKEVDLVSQLIKVDWDPDF